MIRLYFKSIEISVWIFYNCTYLLAFTLSSQKHKWYEVIKISWKFIFPRVPFYGSFFISNNLVTLCQIHLWVPPKKMNSSSFKAKNHNSYHANHCPYFLSIIIVVKMQQPVDLSFSNQNKILGKHKTDNCNQL